MKAAGVFTAVALLVVVQQVISSASDCTRSQCINLRQCPTLIQLLRNPTASNIRELQAATCYINNRTPFVCCPSTTVTTEPPVAPTKSLLPEKCGDSSHFNRIIGGEVAPINAYPWKAVLGYKEIGFDGVQFLCGGSVINDRYVMTAAHCVDAGTLGPKRLVTIRLGEWDLTTTEDCEETSSGVFCAPPAQDFEPEEIIQHESYNTRVRFSDDIAIIRLNRKINFLETAGFISPVCLPPSSFVLRTAVGNRPTVAAGWGFTENRTSSNRIKHVNLPLVDSTQCNDVYKGAIVNEQICAGGRAGEDSCGGDSGGPLVISGEFGPPYQQIGVVSYGPVDCGQEGIPGVYTSVSSYRAWIEQNLKP